MVEYGRAHRAQSDEGGEGKAEAAEGETGHADHHDPVESADVPPYKVVLDHAPELLLLPAPEENQQPRNEEEGEGQRHDVYFVQHVECL
jgi:hypothetical protein